MTIQVNIAEAKGRVRIISVVPSVDTPTCEAQTHLLSEKDKKLAEKIDMITISMDLPFAQQRFRERDSQVARTARHLGATPVFCDVQGDTLNMDPEALRRALTPRGVSVGSVSCVIEGWSAAAPQPT